MKHRKKLKPWAKALIAVTACLALPLFIVYGSWVHPFGCHHKLNPIVSAEMVSQEAPLVFYQLMEQPTIEGIKVKLIYEDGSSEVVDAYDSQRHFRFGTAQIHEKGMFFYGLDIHQLTRPALEPGFHQIPMYCADTLYAQYRDPESDPHAADFVSCMVEVYAQTGDEYLAGHELANNVTVMPSEDVIFTPKGMGLEVKSLVRLLAEESGTYELKIDGGHCLFFSYQYTGSGALLEHEIRSNSGYAYAQLNANEPLFAPVYPFEDNATLRISLTRLPE